MGRGVYPRRIPRQCGWFAGEQPDRRDEVRRSGADLGYVAPMSDAKHRAWWWHRQGLDGSLRGKTAAEVLEHAGWARSVAGIGPYLTLFARGGIGREAADAAVAGLAIHELPSARGCTYIVPARDFALALTVAEDFSGGDFRAAAKLGVTDAEIEKLCAGVKKALARGPLDPDGIRDASGTLSRSLGEEGKKKGMSTTLPMALGRLQVRGDIRRVPVNGRLDQQRYLYTLWSPNPRAGREKPTSEAFTELARLYFKWVGPATLGELQWFTGLGVKASKDAAAPLALVPCETGSDRLLLPEDAEAFRAFKAPTKPQYALVSSLDSISAARRDVRTLLDADDLERRVQLEKKEGELGGLGDLPNHAILDRGRLVGLWEYDVDTREIVYATFGIKDKALEAAVKETEAFVRDELGDARSFSLDSPKSRAPKIAALRKMK
jgi:winged helix DNA-binding protein